MAFRQRDPGPWRPRLAPPLNTAVAVDSAHPLTAGLKSVFVAGRIGAGGALVNLAPDLSAANKTLGYFSAKPVGLVTTAVGPAARFDSNTNYSFYSTALAAGPAMPLTMAAYVTWGGTVTGFPAFYGLTNPVTWNYYLLKLESGANGLCCEISFGGADLYLLGPSSPVANRPYFVVVSSSSATSHQALFVDTVTGQTWAPTSTTDIGTGTAANYECIGGTQFPGAEVDYLDGSVLGAWRWNRVLSLGEMTALALAPFDMLRSARRRAYSVPAGGTNATVTPGAGSIALAGAAPTVSTGASVSPGAGSVALAGAAPTVAAGVSTAPGAGSVALAGTAPTVAAGASTSPGAGSIAMAGAAPTILAGIVIAPGAGSVVLAGAAPTVAAGASTAPGAGSVTLAGAAPTVLTGLVIAPGAGSIALAGAAPTLVRSATVTPGAGSVALAGAAPTVSAGGSVVVTPGAGSVVLSGGQPQVLAINPAPVRRPLVYHGRLLMHDGLVVYADQTPPQLPADIDYTIGVYGHSHYGHGHYTDGSTAAAYYDVSNYDEANYG